MSTFSGEHQTKRVLLEPGVYRVRVGRWVTVETPFNTCVEFRFDLCDKGLKRYRIEASVNAELIGGEQPSEVKVQAPGFPARELRSGSGL